jgi:hypothetical protein
MWTGLQWTVVRIQVCSMEIWSIITLTVRDHTKQYASIPGWETWLVSVQYRIQWNIYENRNAGHPRMTRIGRVKPHLTQTFPWTGSEVRGTREREWCTDA